MARDVAASALACAALYAVAGTGSLLLLAGGSSALEGDVGERIAYIEQHATAWRIGWMLWALAGLAVVLFYGRVAPFDVPGRIAVGLAISGFTVRVVADMALALLLPLEPTLHVAVEQWALALAGFVGHGLETLAGILIVWGAWRSGRLPDWLVMTSLPLWLSGGVLCGAVLAGSGVGVFAATVALVVSAVTWYTAVGVTAWKAQ